MTRVQRPGELNTVYSRQVPVKSARVQADWARAGKVDNMAAAIRANALFMVFSKVVKRVCGGKQPALGVNYGGLPNKISDVPHVFKQLQGVAKLALRFR